MTLILFGFPCCGKTSVGANAANRLCCPFIDTDQEVEKVFHIDNGHFLNCRSITQTYGLPYFRALEEEVIAHLSSSPPSIIALGGGAIFSEANHRHLAQIGRLIYLNAPFTALAERNLFRMPRPTYLDPNDPHGSLQKLYESREKHYKRLAQITVDTTDLNVSAVADEIIKLAGVQHGQ